MAAQQIGKSERIHIGDQPVITATWKNTAGAVTDPSNATFRHVEPDDTRTDYVYGTDDEVTKSASGVYVFTVPVITQSGNHFVGPQSTAGLIAADEVFFVVERTKFPPA